MAIIKKPIKKTLFLLSFFAGAILILISGFYVSIPIADAKCWTIGGGSGGGGGRNGGGDGPDEEKDSGTVSTYSSVVTESFYFDDFTEEDISQLDDDIAAEMATESGYGADADASAGGGRGGEGCAGSEGSDGSDGGGGDW